MSRHEVYYQQRVVPCPCGSHEAYWHTGTADDIGTRFYACDACWASHPQNPAQKARAHAEAQR